MEQKHNHPAPIDIDRTVASLSATPHLRLSPWAAPGPWIGAIELGDSNEFVWASSNSPIEVPNWSPSRPNSPSSGDGVALDVANFFEWIDLSNGTEIPILCEIPSNPPPVELTCPEGFFSLGDSCYAVFDDDADQMTWDNAQTFCASLAAGGRLVEFETVEEIAYWIGAEEFGSSDIYSWASTGQWIVFYDWASDQPNDGTSGDAIRLRSDNLKWQDGPKTHSWRFICEAPPIAV
ncbi:unnamed protein product [Cyprideis torosa]|uniref:Uncharacterized protein n=1 Tax=Cyprideis torosa TaxID=163714 RepID=A0A7R8WJ34_9CRUS|nr:unnamed protein product [Cyprideis torosa]CAG0895314.1 unnamed protein product [Cyprideis torosa]